MFHNEKAESYFVPYFPPEKKRKLIQIENEIDSSIEEEKGKGVGPKGKLWNKYVNVRHALNTANASKVTKSINVCEKENKVPDENDQEKQFLNFLKVAIEPFNKVLEAWENSSKLRRKLYGNAGLTEIYKEFPCLKQNNGIELVSYIFINPEMYYVKMMLNYIIFQNIRFIIVIQNF